MAAPGNKMLRNADTDIGGLTQWLGRKMRNHNPLSQMKEVSIGRDKHNVQVGADMKGNRVFYSLAGRNFEVSVREVKAHEIPEGLEDVGY